MQSENVTDYLYAVLNSACWLAVSVDGFGDLSVCLIQHWMHKASQKVLVLNNRPIIQRFRRLLHHHSEELELCIPHWTNT